MWQQKDLNLVLLFDYKRYKMENIKLAEIASQVRRDILRMVHAVSSGHPGGSLGCADFLTFLYSASFSESW